MIRQTVIWMGAVQAKITETSISSEIINKVAYQHARYFGGDQLLQEIEE